MRTGWRSMRCAAHTADRAFAQGIDCQGMDELTRCFLLHAFALPSQKGGLSGSAVALDALADIDMLGDCDLFVMLLRSCMARVAYALAMGRQGRPLPIISLEAPWSPYKGLKSMKAMFKMRPGVGGVRGRGSRGRAGWRSVK